LGFSVLIAVTIIAFVAPTYVVIAAMVPAIVFSFYMRNWLILMMVIGIMVIIGIATYVVLTPSLYATEYGQFMLYLFGIIYPYRMGTQFSMFYDPLFLGIALGIIIFSVCISSIIRFSTFRTMISFSYLVWGFSTIYIILNMLFYLFPAIETFMLTNPSAQWLSMFFYGMCPFITLTLMIFFLFTIGSYRDRANYSLETKKIKATKVKSKSFKLLKYLAYIALITVAITFFAFAFTQ
jgi:hypothetical protein